MERCFRSQKMERNGKVKQYILDTSVVIKWFSDSDYKFVDRMKGFENIIRLHEL